MITIYTFYKFDTTDYTYVGVSRSATNKTGIAGYTIEKPISVGKGKLVTYTNGVGPWVEIDDPNYTLAADKVLAISSINASAEQHRTQQITQHAIQNLVYLEKNTQALAYKAAGYPVDTTPYPFIAGDVIALSKTATAAADDIIAEYNATLGYNVLVEQYRLQTQVAINASATSTEIKTAISDFGNLLDSITA